MFKKFKIKVSKDFYFDGTYSSSYFIFYSNCWGLFWTKLKGINMNNSSFQILCGFYAGELNYLINIAKNINSIKDVKKFEQEQFNKSIDFQNIVKYEN